MSEEQVSIAVLNQVLLGVFGHGIHTCIVAFALWAICVLVSNVTVSCMRQASLVSSKERLSKARNFMVFFIVLLYIFATICVATNWAYTIYHFIGKGSSSFVQKLHRWPGVAMGINAGIADCITIWRCWIIWGRRWSVIILPILLSLAQAVCGSLALQRNIHYTATGHSPSEVDWTIIYLSCSLGTTLLCTTLIIYRIVTVKKCTDDGANTNTYRRVIEILVESASLYAIGLIGYIVLLTLNVITSYYPQVIYVSITAISPTLIAARVASGNARPNDSWQASNNASSLRFGSAAQSTSVNVDSELTVDGQDVDLEQGGSEATDNRELEHVANTGQVPENRGKKAASKI